MESKETIVREKEKIEQALKNMHPDSPGANDLRKRYRELDKGKD